MLIVVLKKKKNVGSLWSGRILKKEPDFLQNEAEF